MSHNFDIKRKQFEEIFLAQYPTFLSLGISKCGDKEFVKDTIQLFFLELWEKEIWTTDIQAPKAYLFTSFYRKLYAELKKNSKLPDAFPDLSEAQPLAYFAQEQESIDYLLQLQSQVLEAMNELPTEQQQMLRYKYQEGLEYQEIADFTGKSKQTIYNQIHSSLKKLRARVAKKSFPLQKD